MSMSGTNEDREASDRAAKDSVLASFDGTADGENPYQAPGADIAIGPHEPADDEPGFRRAKRKIILAILLLFALSGFLVPLTAGDPVLLKGLDLVTAIALAAFLLRWCQYDRRERHIKRWPFFAAMMILCPGPLILMPIYFLATRGLRGLFSILMAAALFGLAIVATVAGIAVSAALFGRWEHLFD
jgi:hypothetical protein